MRSNELVRDRVGIAVVGCGRIARNVHLPALSRIRAAEIVAVIDPDPRALDEACRATRAAEGYADLADGLAAPGVDAAVLCLPSPLHADAALAALGAGLHVYVEKPVATELIGADSVVAAWHAAGTVGMTGFNFRFRDDVRRAHAQLHNDELGDVVMLRSVFCVDSPVVPAWKTEGGSGGSALLDQGIHHLDLAAHLLDEALEVHDCLAHSVRRHHDTVAITLRSASGIPVSIAASSCAAPTDTIEVVGSRGTLVLERQLKGNKRERSYDAALETFVDACRGKPMNDFVPDLIAGRNALALALDGERLASPAAPP